jgi:uncharacterized membrane protein
MDAGQLVFAYSRLFLGALAAFFAIMLWSKTRDAAWMLIVIGVIVAYIGIVHSVLEISGIAEIMEIPGIEAYAPLAKLLPALSTVFFIAAFLVMVIRQRNKENK